jgi:hypothetical protein
MAEVDKDQDGQISQFEFTNAMEEVLKHKHDCGKGVPCPDDNRV